MNLQFDELRQEIIDLREDVTSMILPPEVLEQRYYDAQKKLYELKYEDTDELDFSNLDKIMEEMNTDLDLYDSESELKSMFPNRDDDDDDDEMSGSSFFKD
jgi:hypothetical protein